MFPPALARTARTAAAALLVAGLPTAANATEPDATATGCPSLASDLLSTQRQIAEIEAMLAASIEGDRRSDEDRRVQRDRELMTELARALATTQALHLKLDAKEEAVGEELERLKAANVELEATLQAAASESGERLAVAAAELELANAQNAELKAHLAAATQRHDTRTALERRLAEQTAAGERLRLALADCDAAKRASAARCLQLEAELETLRAGFDRSRAGLEAERTARARLEARVAELEAALAALPEPPPPPLAVLRFDKNADETRRDRELLLAGVTAILSDRPDARFDIVGHTCDTGSSKANRNLSQRRAEGVRSLLIEGGVPAGQLTARGVGEACPTADNGTAEGRRLNRRVEVHVIE